MQCNKPIQCNKTIQYKTKCVINQCNARNQYLLPVSWNIQGRMGATVDIGDNLLPSLTVFGCSPTAVDIETCPLSDVVFPYFILPSSFSFPWYCAFYILHFKKPIQCKKTIQCKKPIQCKTYMPCNKPIQSKIPIQCTKPMQCKTNKCNVTHRYNVRNQYNVRK